MRKFLEFLMLPRIVKYIVTMLLGVTIFFTVVAVLRSTNIFEVLWGGAFMAMLIVITLKNMNTIGLKSYTSDSPDAQVIARLLYIFMWCGFYLWFVTAAFRATL